VRIHYSKYGAAARDFRQASEIEEPLEPRTNNCLALGPPDRKVTGFDDMTQYALDMLSLYQLSHGGMSGRSNGSDNINIAVRRLICNTDMVFMFRNSTPVQQRIEYPDRD
jgi:hypothetical protein